MFQLQLQSQGTATTDTAAGTATTATFVATTTTEAIGEDENLLQDLNLNFQTPVGSEKQLSNPYLDIQHIFIHQTV